MVCLEWVDSDGIHRCDGYTIECVDSSSMSWSLRLDPSHLPLGLTPRDSGRRYRNLRSARAAATHLEITRLRRMKFIRHGILAVVSLIASVVSYQMISLPHQGATLEWFAAALITMYIALSESLSGLLLLIDDGWDQRYEVPRITRLDRLCARLFFPKHSTARGDVLRSLGADERVRIVHPS